MPHLRPFFAPFKVFDPVPASVNGREVNGEDGTKGDDGPGGFRRTPDGSCGNRRRCTGTADDRSPCRRLRQLPQRATWTPPKRWRAVSSRRPGSGRCGSTAATSAPRIDGALHFKVLVLSREMAEQKISAEGVGAGRPRPGGEGLRTRLHLFASGRCARRRGISGCVGDLLGRVLAHEVGHLAPAGEQPLGDRNHVGGHRPEPDGRPRRSRRSRPTAIRRGGRVSELKS